MGKIAGNRVKIQKPKTTGRPKLSERTHLSKQDLDYAQLRSKGMSIAQASKSINRPISEMQRLEREFGLLRMEIAERRQEKLHVDTDSLTAFLYNDMLKIDGLIEEMRLDPERRDITEILKIAEALRGIKSDMEDLEERAKQEGASKKPGEESDNRSMNEFLHAVMHPGEFKECIEGLDPKGPIARGMLYWMDPKLFLEKIAAQVKAELLAREKPQTQARPKRRLLKYELPVVQQTE